MNNISLLIGVLLGCLLFWGMRRKGKQVDGFKNNFICPCRYRSPPCNCSQTGVSGCRIGNCACINRTEDYSIYNSGNYQECDCEYGRCSCMNKKGDIADIYNTDLQHLIEPFNRYDVPRDSECGPVTSNDGIPCDSAVSYKTLRERSMEGFDVNPEWLPWWSWNRRVGILNDDPDDNTIRYPSCNNSTAEPFTVEGVNRYYDSRLQVLDGADSLESCLNHCASDNSCVTSLYVQDRYTPPTCFVSKQLEYPNDEFDRVYIKLAGNKFARMNNRVQNTTGSDPSEFMTGSPIQGYKINWDSQITHPLVRTGDFLNRYRNFYKEEENPSTVVVDDASKGKGGTVDPKAIQRDGPTKPVIIPKKSPTTIPKGFIDPTKVIPQDYPILPPSSPVTTDNSKKKIDFTAGITQDTKIGAKQEVKLAEQREAERRAAAPWVEHFEEPFMTDDGTFSSTDPRLYHTQYYKNYRTNNPNKYHYVDPIRNMEYTPY